MTVRPALLIFAVLNLLQGLSIVIAPRRFYEALADFGPYGPHYLRDAATTNLALAVAFYVAWQRPAWRVPVLTVAGLQALFHAINHFVDIPDAETAFVGWFDAISLLVLTLLYFGLVRRAQTEEVSA